MKITLESTSRVCEVVSNAGGPTVLGRVWEGQTETGIQIVALITRIGVPAGQNQDQFLAELEETKAPELQLVFPLKMII